MGENVSINFKCNICGSISSMKPKSVIKKNNRGCKNCGYVTIGKNDLWTTDPEIAKLLVNPEDGYRCSRGSIKKFEFRCPDCGSIKKESVINIIGYHFVCRYCSDGISIPEKFMSNFLSMNSVIFKNEQKFNWSNNKIYDFFVNNNIIIETHGQQHYTKNTSFTGTTLKEQQQNDSLKRNLAIKNGIEYYFELDCRYSELEHIKNSILNSNIPTILNLNLENFNWEECFKKSLKSKVIEACELWNKGYNSIDTQKELNISIVTVIRYLKIGASLDLCNYTPEKSQKRGHLKRQRKVICLNDRKMFDSIRIASNFYEADEVLIMRVCSQERKSVISPKIKERLVFSYFDDYDPNKDYSKILKKAQQKSFKKVRCINTGEIFSSIKEAILKYNITSYSTIGLCCKGKQKTSGELNGEKLRWEYYED